MDWAPTVAIGLSLALVFGTFARRLNQSPLLGYLFAGVLIGPHTPGFVGSADLAEDLADVGVMLLMFGVGLGFSLRDLLAVRKVAVPGAIAASGAVVALGAGMFALFGWPIGGAAVLGMCLATASTVLIVRGMSDLGILNATPGRIAVGWSLVEDIFTIVLLVVLPAMATGGREAGEDPLLRTVIASILRLALLVVVVLWGCGPIVPRLLAFVARAQSRELFTLAVLALLLGIAFLASEVFGVSIALGAFLAGMVVGRSDLAHQAAADALPMRDAFAVLFFVAVGMLFDPRYVFEEPLSVLAALTLVFVAKPFVAIWMIVRKGNSMRTALSVGAGLAQVSEFSFLLAGVATELGLLPAGGRDLVVAVALTSIAANPILFRGIGPIERWLTSQPFVAKWIARHAGTLAEPPSPLAEPRRDHVVLCGYGRVGSVLGEMLAARGVPFVVVEMDRVVVDQLRQRGIPALWGDAGSPVLLDRAHVATARAVALTAPDPVTQRLAMEHIRSVRPDAQILVRAHDDASMAQFERMPNTKAVHGERSLGLAMARELLVALGSNRVEADVLVRASSGTAAPSLTKLQLFEVVVPASAECVGKTIAELRLPAAALVVAIVRDGAHQIAREGTQVRAQDTVLVCATSEDAREVEGELLRSAGAG